MSRQQAINYKYVTLGTDVWALAASMYNMLTNKFPRDFSGSRPWYEVLLETKPIPIKQRDSSIPARLAQLIDYALDDSSDDFPFESASAFKQELQEAMKRC